MNRKKALSIVNDQEAAMEEYIKMTRQLFESPFVKDRKFVLHHLVKISRDELNKKE